jgi:hypothetical protein
MVLFKELSMHPSSNNGEINCETSIFRITER